MDIEFTMYNFQGDYDQSRKGIPSKGTPSKGTPLLLQG